MLSSGLVGSLFVFQCFEQCFELRDDGLVIGHLFTLETAVQDFVTELYLKGAFSALPRLDFQSRFLLYLGCQTGSFGSEASGEAVFYGNLGLLPSQFFQKGFLVGILARLKLAMKDFIAEA